MGLFSFSDDKTPRPPPLTGGPLGLGDPDDKRLRKTEKTIIIPNMLRKEALKKCDCELNEFLDCAKREGLMVVFKCRKENDVKNDCVYNWVHNDELIEEVTNQYLEARSYYRRTGKPLVKYERKKENRSSWGFC